MDLRIGYAIHVMTDKNNHFSMTVEPMHGVHRNLKYAFERWIEKQRQCLGEGPASKWIAWMRSSGSGVVAMSYDLNIDVIRYNLSKRMHRYPSCPST